MNAWSNIQISPDDPEIIKIDNLEKKLGKLSDRVRKIRELITRFEVCHFKYQQHIGYIKDSIQKLEPYIDPAEIGAHHIHHGAYACEKDTTGRSLIGQHYLQGIKEWLDDNPAREISGIYKDELGPQIQNWLGEKSPEKEKLVRLLVARLSWDWKSYTELQGGEFKDIELQACAMDICHYSFPGNLDLLLQAIGQMKPVNKFEGCGSYTNHIKACIEVEFSVLNHKFEVMIERGKSDKNELIKAWLIACLAKTLKEAVHLSQPVNDLAD